MNYKNWKNWAPNSDEIERALEGPECGIDHEQMVRAAVLAVLRGLREKTWMSSLGQILQAEEIDSLIAEYEKGASA